jgi:hypothetical protein
MLELLSLVDFDYQDPYDPDLVPRYDGLPRGHYFTNVDGNFYHWTSTIASDNFGTGAWIINMGVMGGDASKDGQAIGQNRVWCVRDPE